MSTNLVKQNILVPKDETSGDSDMEFHESQQNTKKNWMKKVKTVLGRMLSCKSRSKSANGSRGASANPKETFLSNPQSLLPRIVKDLPSARLFMKPRMRKLSQNGNQRQLVVKCQGQGGIVKLGRLCLQPKVWHLLGACLKCRISGPTWVY